MTPGARVAAAISVLDAWCGGVPLEKALTNWARGARYAGSGDRAAVRDHVHNVLRSKGRCEALGQGGDGRALMIGLIRLQGDVPDALFTGEGHAPAPLSETELVAPSSPPDPLADVPEWLVPMLRDRAGEDLGALVEALARRAPVWLRVNARKAGAEEAIAVLARDGVTTRRDARGAHALEVVDGTRRIRASAAYAQGLVELQDLSSQRAIEAVDWPRGHILDYCAGGGGKALAIAALSDAAICAHDAEPRRMRDLPARAARAGVSIPTCPAADLRRLAPFDAVLCDVPCSGSGTWRRDPEAKWRLSPDRLDALVSTQAQILRDAAPLVRAGGRLVYMTCSFLSRENEAQVAAFLATHRDWRLLDEGVDTPLTASDGFYRAVLGMPA